MKNHLAATRAYFRYQNNFSVVNFQLPNVAYGIHWVGRYLKDMLEPPSKCNLQDSHHTHVLLHIGFEYKHNFTSHRHHVFVQLRHCAFKVFQTRTQTYYSYYK